MFWTRFNDGLIIELVWNMALIWRVYEKELSIDRRSVLGHHWWKDNVYVLSYNGSRYVHLLLFLFKFVGLAI